MTKKQIDQFIKELEANMKTKKQTGLDEYSDGRVDGLKMALEMVIMQLKKYM